MSPAQPFLVAWEGDVAGALFGPDGRQVDAPESVYQDSRAGRWILEVATNGRPADYLFLLRIGDAVANDAGSGRDAGTGGPTPLLELPEGASAGRLDRFDREDRYYFTLARNESAEVSVALPDGAFAALKEAPADWGDAQYEAPFEVAPGAPRAFVLSIFLEYWAPQQPLDYEGGYQVALARSGGEGARLALAPATMLGARGHGLFALAQGGVELFEERTVRRVDATGVVDVVELGWNVEALARDAEGDLLASMRSWNGVETAPILREVGASDRATWAPRLIDMAFGPDGALYGISFDTLYRFAGGDVEVVATGLPSAREIAFSPSGECYLVASWDILRVDLATGARTPVATSDYFTGVAFDTAGRLYTSLYFAGVVVRITPTTGAVGTVALAPSWPGELAFAPDGLYLGGEWGGPLARLDVADATGFPGFVGSFAAPDVVDVAVVAFREEAQSIEVADERLTPSPSETRELVVTLANEGAGAVQGRVRLNVWSSTSSVLFPGPWWEIVLEDGLAPGETREVRIPWNTTGDLGSQSLYAHATPLDDVELDGSDNRAYLGSYVVAPVRIGPLI